MAVQFSGPITTQNDESPGAAFKIGTDAPLFVNSSTADTVFIAFPSTYPPGTSWSLTAQPAWVIETVAAPESGHTS